MSTKLHPSKVKVAIASETIQKPSLMIHDPRTYPATLAQRRPKESRTDTKTLKGSMPQVAHTISFHLVFLLRPLNLAPLRSGAPSCIPDVQLDQVFYTTPLGFNKSEVLQGFVAVKGFGWGRGFGIAFLRFFFSAFINTIQTPTASPVQRLRSPSCRALSFGVPLLAHRRGVAVEGSCVLLRVGSGPMWP